MSSYLSPTSNLRIGGLASGIDTDSIVGQMMKAKRVPLDKLKQQRQVLEWQQEDYRAINKSLRAFRDTVFNMRLQATYLAKKAASSDEAVVGASAAAGAAPGVYSVTVAQLAQGVTRGSQAGLPDEAGEGGSTKTLAEQFGLSGTIEFVLEGSRGSKGFSFDASTTNIYQVVSAVNAAGLGITAGYDAAGNRFYLTTSSTGEAAKIRVTADSHNFLSGPAGDGSDSVLKLKLKTGETYTGQDAVFSFGDAFGLKSSTNTVTVAGITLTLKRAGTAAVTVSADTDAVYSAIKGLVDAYNELVAKINGKLSETRYRDYAPLTDEQREKLTDEQEKKWEERARSGLLRNDPLLQGIVNKMRATAGSSPGGLSSAYKNLASIGITTGSYAEKGKLYIDEAKLKDALQKDLQGVMELFTRSSSNYSEMGIAQRLYQDVNNAISQISAKAGGDSAFAAPDSDAIGRQLKYIDESIAKMEGRLKKEEDRLWRQFTAMEEAVSRMNAQSAWLASYLGLGGSQSQK